MQTYEYVQLVGLLHTHSMTGGCWPQKLAPTLMNELDTMHTAQLNPAQDRHNLRVQQETNQHKLMDALPLPWVTPVKHCCKTLHCRRSLPTPLRLRVTTWITLQVTLFVHHTVRHTMSHTLQVTKHESVCVTLYLHHPVVTASRPDPSTVWQLAAVALPEAKAQGWCLASHCQQGAWDCPQPISHEQASSNSGPQLFCNCPVEELPDVHHHAAQPEVDGLQGRRRKWNRQPGNIQK